MQGGVVPRNPRNTSINFYTDNPNSLKGARSHSKTMASSLGCHFLYTCACTRPDHLTMTLNYSGSLNWKYSWCAYLGMGLKNRCMCCQSNEPLEKTEVGPYQYCKCEYMNEWSILSMLFECLDLWIPPTVRTGFVIHPENGWLGVWMDAGLAILQPITASVANTRVNGQYIWNTIASRKCAHPHFHWKLQQRVIYYLKVCPPNKPK